MLWRRMKRFGRSLEESGGGSEVGNGRACHIPMNVTDDFNNKRGGTTTRGEAKWGTTRTGRGEEEEGRRGFDISHREELADAG